MTRSPDVRRAWLGLGVVLALGALLRAPLLGLEELTTDEAFSWRLATYPPAETAARTATDVHPPLYYLALEGWMKMAGDGPAALRSLSLILGLAAVGLAYLLYVETGRAAGDGGRRAGRWGAVAAALLVAVHADQVEHSRHVRMYGLGSALAALTAWLMLRALRSERRAYSWWTGYAVAAAALCYTHYYGAFTVAAQLVSAVILLARRGAAARIGARQVAGLLGAAVLVAALFAPWLPVLRRQTARVSEDYWIHEAGSFDVAGALVRWATGLDWTPPLPALVIAAFAAAGLWVLVRGDDGQRFLVIQAGLPWLGALGLSWAAGRTLFLERYLAFAQIAVLVLAARGWAGLSTWPRRVTATVMGSLLALGLSGEIGARPTAAPSAEAGARLLAASVGPDDFVLANAPRDLNVVRYYLHREGADRIALRCPARRSVGHLSQVSSITPEEIVGEESVWGGSWARVWFVRLHPTRKWRPETPAGWAPSSTRVLEGPNGTRLLVISYQRVTP